MNNNNEELEFDSLPNSKKYGFKINPILIFVIAAVCVIGVIVGFNFKKISNAVMRTASSPAKYFQHVQKEEVATAVASVSKAYGNIIKGKERSSSFDFSNGIGIDYFLRASLGANGQEMLSSISGMDFGWLKSAEVLTFVDYRNDNLQEGVKLKLNGADVLSLSGLATSLTDHERGELYISVPEVLTKSLKIPVSALKSMIYEGLTEAGIDIPEVSYNEEAMQVLFDSADAIADAMPDEKTFEKLLTRYVNAVLDSIENAEKTTSERSVGEISEKVTEITVHLDQATVSKIIKSVCETAAKDEDLEQSCLQIGDAAVNAAKAIAEASGQDGSEFDNVDLKARYAEFKDKLTKTAEKSDELAKAYVEVTNINYIIFVTNDGKIAGRRIEVADRFEDGINTRAYEILTIADGKQLGLRLSVFSELKNEADETAYAHETIILSEATRTGSELTGTVKVLEENEQGVREVLGIKFEELDIGSILKGKLKGTLIFDVQKVVELLTANSDLGGIKVLLKGASFVCKLDFDLPDLKCIAELELRNAENSDVLKATFGFERNEEREIIIPDAKNCVVLTNIDDLSSIYSAVSISKLIEELKAAEFPSEYVTTLESIEPLIRILLPSIVEAIIYEIEDRLEF